MSNYNKLYARIYILFCNCIVFAIGLQNDHKSIMKLIEEKIHQLHEEARNKQNKQMNKGEITGRHSTSFSS